MRAALNSEQLAVLRWISDGCAEGVYYVFRSGAVELQL